MKIYNSKRLFQILLSGIILMNVVGCGKQIEIEEPTKTPVVESSSNQTTIENQTSIKEEIESSTQKVEAEKENQIVEKVNEYYTKIVEYLNSEDFKEKEDSVLSYFFKVTDFLFYEEPISGVTFKELSIEAQLKLISMYQEVDQMIENRYPNYQEKVKTTFGETYESIKNKTIEAKDYLIIKVKEQIGEEKYTEYTNKINEVTNTWKQKYQEFQEAHGEEIKQGFSELWQNTKEEGSKVKDKINDWYQNFKEQHTK